MTDNSYAELTWRKSQRCDNGACVEVAQLGTNVALRDSTRPDGAILRFSTRDWERLLVDVQADRLLAP